MNDGCQKYHKEYVKRIDLDNMMPLQAIYNNSDPLYLPGYFFIPYKNKDTTHEYSISSVGYRSYYGQLTSICLLCFMACIAASIFRLYDELLRYPGFIFNQYSQSCNQVKRVYVTQHNDLFGRKAQITEST